MKFHNALNVPDSRSMMVNDSLVPYKRPQIIAVKAQNQLEKIIKE